MCHLLAVLHAGGSFGLACAMLAVSAAENLTINAYL